MQVVQAMQAMHLWATLILVDKWAAQMMFSPPIHCLLLHPEIWRMEQTMGDTPGNAKYVVKHGAGMAWHPEFPSSCHQMAYHDVALLMWWRPESLQ